MCSCVVLIQDKDLEATNGALQKLRSHYKEIRKEIEDVQANNQRESTLVGLEVLTHTPFH